MSHDEVRQSGSGSQASSSIPLTSERFTSSYALQTLLRILKKRWKWIAASTVLCEVLTIVVVLSMKPTYDATATIQLNKTSSSLDLGLGDVLSQQLSSGGDSLLTDLQTETAILKDDSLALSVIEELDLASQPPFATVAPDPREAAEKGLPLEEAPHTRNRLLTIFHNNLNVSTVRGTRLIDVTYESHDPRQAAEIANALIDSYKRQYLQSHYAATSETSDWLAKQLTELKNNVQDSEKKLTDFEKASGILSFGVMGSGDSKDSAGEPQIHSVIIQKLDTLNQELTAAEANRIEKEAIYRLAKTGNEDVVLGIGNDAMAVQSNSLVLSQGGGLSTLQQLRAQESQLKINIAQAMTVYGPGNRHIKELETQLQAVNAQIAQELQQIVKRAQVDFELAQRDEDEIRRQFDQQQAAATQLNEKAVEFSVLSQEAYSRKRLYEDLYTKLQEANVAAGIKATNITIVDPARPQAIPSRPKKRVDAFLGLIFGAFLGFVIAYIGDSLDRTVSNPFEIEELTGRPVIGIIPKFETGRGSYGYGLQRVARKRAAAKAASEAEPSEPAKQVWSLEHPHSSAAEAFRALRTSIMHSRAGGGPKVILVTSCTPTEGKTTVTSNLGVVYAQYNKKVIIIEADMRRPRMTHVMQVANEVGLSTVLAGSCTPEEAIVRERGVPMLDVLPAGPRPPMPSEMLGSSAFDDLIQYLRHHYDVILIDSPPILLVTDAVTISPRADVTIWVARAGQVTRPQLARATHLIERNRMQITGFVVNGISEDDSEYGYTYYGTYYGEENSSDA